jgi:toxin ParE1/3/4
VRLRYTLPALADLDAILEYLDDRSPRGAANVGSRIQTAIAMLLHNPFIGTRTDDPTIRRLATSPYPYLVFYETSNDELLIHAIRRAARNPSSMPGAGRRESP